MSLSRVLGTWVVLAVAMSANGVFREAVLRPFLGHTADRLSAVIGIAIIALITRSLLRARAPLPLSYLTGVSALLVGLTVGFEFLVGRYVDRKSWSALIANYAVWEGRLWPVVLMAVALMPFVWGRWAAKAE